jgi:hypothetical protein
MGLSVFLGSELMYVLNSFWALTAVIRPWRPGRVLKTDLDFVDTAVDAVGSDGAYLRIYSV